MSRLKDLIGSFFYYIIGGLFIKKMGICQAPGEVFTRSGYTTQH